MNLIARQIYGNKQGGAPNTFIGGISSTISTAALLASKLGISVGAISNFSVVGSDIKCKITGSYTLPDSIFAYDTNITYYQDISGLITSCIGNNHFLWCVNLKYIFFPENTRFGVASFAISIQSTMPLEYIYSPKCTTIGTVTASNNCFQNRIGEYIIYVAPSMATSNGGGVEGDLADAITRYATVRYVANYTAPNPVTTLTTGTIYNTSVQLNFTAPTGSTNTIDYYECYVNGIFKNKVLASGKFTSDLTANSSQILTVYAVDVFMNKSVVSNAVSATTTNRTAVDTDAIAYVSASSNYTYEDIIDDLFASLKLASLYTKIQCFYPMVGATATHHKWNGKNPLNTDAAFRLVFSGGSTHSNLGYQLNGTNAFAETYFAPIAQQSLNNNGATIVTGTNNALGAAGVAVELGSYSGGSQASFLSSKRLPAGRKDAQFNGSAIVVEVGADESRCILTGMRTSSTVSKMVKNGVVIGTGSGGGTLPAFGFQIGRLSLANGQYSTQRIQTVMFHEGLSDAECIALHGIINTFESALGRKTW